ncbi:sigma-70 family RNA polymerase sigma factor [bacterium]|nr:sigma-70 family RNA polymerase sigma factor [bacterium]MDB4793275.1 sigma-70 family RNA polymerase sigma factor [bacterium]
MGQSVDVEILGRAQQGDQDALGRLLRHCRPYLSILASRNLDPMMSARLSGSDIVQQACLEAIRDFENFRGHSIEEFTVWLNQILTHKVLEATRVHIVAQKRSVHREQTRGNTKAADEDHDLISISQSSPSSRAMRGERAIVLANAMADLPENQLEAVRLRYIEGWSLSDIAERTGRSDSAVASLIKRALQKLRISLPNIEGE